jgi:general secretion pathway protein G
VKQSSLKDPWGREYVYQYPGDHGDFDIYSYGADGQPGGEDKNADINSWE